MFQINPWPKTILHLDANAFFASVMQAVNPRLKNKPVVIGAERGIATAVSYEARTLGIKRGELINKIEKDYPQVVVLEGDYGLFSLFSQKMFTILRQYSPVVEEYSVDEGFMDIAGLKRPYHCTYQQIAAKIQAQIYYELGLPVSIGISISKSLAKLASGFIKPKGITVIKGPEIEKFLAKIPLIKIWGVGSSTVNYLNKFGVRNALQFANLPAAVFSKQSNIRLNKAHWEIRQELRGQAIYQINPEVKNHYQSISKTETFRPATGEQSIVWAHLLHNIESAFQKARQYHYSVRKMTIYLKTQQFSYFFKKIVLEQKQQYPLQFRNKIRQAFAEIFKPKQLYRATGVILTELSLSRLEQASLFERLPKISNQKVQALYRALQAQPKLDFGTSLYLPQSQARSHFNLPMLEI
jgi:DNA polymerase-4/DNA polymerase V